MRLLILLAAAIITPTGAQGPQPPSAHQEEWIGFGPGTRTCADWTSDRQQNGTGALVDRSWLGGFLSGMNLSSLGDGEGNLTAGVTLAEMYAWMDRHCAAAPSDLVSEAAEELAATLLVRKQRHH